MHQILLDRCAQTTRAYSIVSTGSIAISKSPRVSICHRTGHAVVAKRSIRVLCGSSRNLPTAYCQHRKHLAARMASRNTLTPKRRRVVSPRSLAQSCASPGEFSARTRVLAPDPRGVQHQRCSARAMQPELTIQQDVRRYFEGGSQPVAALPAHYCTCALLFVKSTFMNTLISFHR